jgi:hypothetical protein
MFTLDKVKDYVKDLTKSEVEVISFVDRTTAEAGHYANVVYKNLATGKREELTVLKKDFGAWLKTYAQKSESAFESFVDKTGDFVGDVVEDAIEFVSDVVDNVLEVAVEITKPEDQTAEDGESILEVAVDKVADTAKSLVNNSSASSVTKAVTSNVIDTLATEAKEKVKSPNDTWKKK